ncbi:hypothetical protein GCM10009798_12040 [Nocardioides panacihumi]|uniref:Uncharacterized protein n=1 Tax=Nocardioides panacihumi TaxID=400774 RepID=A0ABP5C0B5_9ACTN
MPRISSVGVTPGPTPFFGHHVDVTERICHNGTFIKWATQPNISFPGAFNPFATPFESLRVTQKPFIYSTRTCLGGPCRITWRFTVTQGIKGIDVNEFVFYYRAYPARSELCFGKTCAETKWTRGWDRRMSREAQMFFRALGVMLVLYFAGAALFSVIQLLARS